MLEPRRLAAVRAAQFIASLIGEREGDTVGYRIRGDTRVGKQTRIEAVTEGVLTRFLQHEADLPGVGLVIFDEFHERSIHADLGLALTLDVQEHLRNDIRILVMSATLDCAAVSRLMGDVPILQSPGQSYPVETQYRAFPVAGAIEPAVAETTRSALRHNDGDVLVFLPGQREIKRVESELHGTVPVNTDVFALYGEAPAEQQRAALAPAKDGRRKVILATSIAETSLTIDGIRSVVDSGLSRSPRFDPRRGMSGLVTLLVSVATADQRRGRAGRQAPGICYRMWTEEQHKALPRNPVPEIVVTDLAPLLLECALWGAPELTGLRILDRPPQAHVQQARALLQSLGALNADGTPTLHGRRMADLPVHPRLSHMILQGNERGWGGRACDIAAILEERDMLRERPSDDVDLASRLHALSTRRGADSAIRERVLREADRLRTFVSVADRKKGSGKEGILLALAYPERVARRRGASGSHYLMAGGTGAVVPEWSPLAREEFLAIADAEGGGINIRVFLASAVDKADLLDVFAESVVAEEEVGWDQTREAVFGRKTRRLGAMVLEEQAFVPHGVALRNALFEGIRLMGVEALPWSRSALEIQARSEWLRAHRLVPETWPDLRDDHLLETLVEWLAPFSENISNRRQLDRIDLVAALRSLFSPKQLQDLDRLAPSRIVIPTGSRIALMYSSDERPSLAVKLQEMFGQLSTPTVAGGRVSVVLHLLSPAGRPLAVTQDLKSFWSRTYPELRRQMQARYPKHHWPEDPLKAAPTKKTKRR